VNRMGGRVRATRRSPRRHRRTGAQFGERAEWAEPVAKHRLNDRHGGGPVTEDPLGELANPRFVWPLRPPASS
jgi:hypothetical protein